MSTATPATNTPIGTPIGDRMKNELADLHVQAEKAPLQAAMVQGRLTRDAYAAFLGQMLLVHEALERVVAAAAKAHAGVRAVWNPEQNKAALVREDLKFFGGDPAAVKPLPATKAVIDLIQSRGAASPEFAFGLHYVLEGANNGNQFIARIVRKVYALEGAEGTKSLDPYGPRQREVWGAFKTTLNAQQFTEAERDRMVEGGAAMFRAVTDVSDAVWKSVGA